MRNGVWLIAAIALCFIGYVSAGPYLTVNELKEGIQEQDQEKLEANIDFSALRQNLKDQFNAVMNMETSTELEDNPLGVIAFGLVSKIVDGMVDALITPAGMASMMKGNLPKEIDSENPPNDQGADNKEPFADARYSWESISKCSVYVPTEDGDEIRFVLIRDGIKWKLANILLPIDA